MLCAAAPVAVAPQDRLDMLEWLNLLVGILALVSVRLLEPIRVLESPGYRGGQFLLRGQADRHAAWTSTCPCVGFTGILSLTGELLNEVPLHCPSRVVALA